MNMFSRVALVLIGLSSVAAAQAGKAPAAPAAPAATKPAPPPMMKAPQELADMAKMSSGTWKCTGEAMEPGNPVKQPMTATFKQALALDGWWLHTTFESKMGKEPYKFESFTTYDASAKKWKRIMVSTYGGWNTGESAGLVNNKMDWEMAAHSAMGEGMFRDHLDLSDPKAGAKMMGEMSIDGGKNYLPVYSMTCKK